MENPSDRHERALNWFRHHRNQQMSWPRPLQDGTLLATKAKGIYKPRWSDYALSVRLALNGPYANERETLTGGQRFIDYFQESFDPAARDQYFTNRGMIKCMEDDIPIGVIRQVTASPGAVYLIEGLAKVKGWTNGYFRLCLFDHGDS